MFSALEVFFTRMCHINLHLTLTLTFDIDNSCAAISTSRTSSDALFMWLAVTTAAADWKSNRLPYNLYCVGGDVKHCSINHDWKSKTHVTISKVYSSETMPRILVRLIKFMKTSDKCYFRSADLQQQSKQLTAGTMRCIEHIACRRPISLHD